MSGRSRKRGLGDDPSHTCDNEKTKMRKKSRKNSKHESEDVGTPEQQEPHQQQLHPSQVNERSTKTAVEVEPVIKSKPNIHNKKTGGDGLASSFAATEEPPENSNLLRKVGESNLNAALLKKLGKFPLEGANKIAVEEMSDMIKQRMTLIKDPKYQYSLEAHQPYNQELLKKLRLFEHSAGIPNGNIIVQELIEMLQSDIENSAQSMCPFSRYLTDFDLMSCIVKNINSVAAQRIVRARKLQLKTLSVNCNWGNFELMLHESALGDSTAGTNDLKCRVFQHGGQLSLQREINVFGLFHSIMQFYDVSQSSIILRGIRSERSINTELLESKFGAPPTNHTEKIRISEMSIESRDMADFFRWICPTTLFIRCNPEVFGDEPSLIDGVDVIFCRGKKVDKLMENCKAREIVLEGPELWSDESIRRVLTAHRLSADNGYPREISDQVRSLDGWKKLLKSWSSAFEAEHGKIGRKVTAQANDVMYCVKLQLH